MAFVEKTIIDIKPKHEFIWKTPYRRHFLDPSKDVYAKTGTLLMDIMRALGIPEYLTEKSNHLFSYPQKIALLVMMELRKLSFRRFEEESDSMINAFNVIGLEKCPDYSTLCRFRKKLNPEHLALVTMAFSAIVAANAIILVDGSAEANYNRSAHYEKRLDEFGQKRINTFTKMSLAVDYETKIIVCGEVDAVNFHKHDTKDIPSIVAKLKESDLDIEYFVADRGYDSEEIHCLVERELGATAVIPVRIRQDLIVRGRCRTKGKHRSRMKRELNDGCFLLVIFHKRPIVEDVNFMMKNNMSGCVSAKLPKTRENTVRIRIIGHNLLRIHRLNAYRLMEA